MEKNVRIEDLGRIDYKEAWDYQEKIFTDMVGSKSFEPGEKYNNYQKINRILLCEHPHVYTLGKSGVQNNLLINDEFLNKIGATYFRINRGGDITYHGPGQIVGYPIIDLEDFNLQVKQYISKLEDSIILTLKEYDIIGSRLEGAIGVWLDPDNKSKARKICAIGVKASRFITMHGFAFNVNTSLDYFNHINPCGFIDKGVTSLEKELGQKQDIEEVKSKVIKNLARVFNFTIEK